MSIFTESLFINADLQTHQTCLVLLLGFFCQAPGLVQCPGSGPVQGPGQGLNSEFKIQCQILKRKDLERHYNQTGHPTPPPPEKLFEALTILTHTGFKLYNLLVNNPFTPLSVTSINLLVLFLTLN